MSFAAFRVVTPFLAVALSVGCVLAVAMISANWHSLGWSGSLEMVGVTVWVGIVFNALLLIPIVALWPILVISKRNLFRGRWTIYCFAALISLNVVWILWNRLAMTHQWASVRPFITVAGLVQTIALLVIVGIVVAIPFLRIQGRLRGALVASAIVVLSVAVLLVWNGWDERRFRRYSLKRIGRAASVQNVDVQQERLAGESPRVVLLGLDGLSWNVMVPLMEAGALPALSTLIQNGAFGYLDNGDESLSPIVWTSIFTGRTRSGHGIDGYRKLDLPLSRRSALDLLLIQPTINSFYGFSHLLKRVPSAGLWNFSHAGSNDRRAPAIWDIASIFGRRVVVVDPLVNLPVKKVNGAAIDFRRVTDPAIATSYPVQLRERWGVEPIPLATGGTDASFDRLEGRVLSGVDITFELAEEHDPDLLLYYSSFPDTISHMNWDFFARDRFFLGNLPIKLTDAEWERLVQDNIDDRLFRAYARTDAIVLRFIEKFPEATFVIVSDHGWTFSGYEHFGSPDGIFIAAGPRNRNGLGLPEVSILDVAPSVLAAMGIPLSRELEGVPIGDAWLETFQNTSVDRYEWSTDGATGHIELDEDELERLRMLGYLN